jgi:hypothetical protein
MKGVTMRFQHKGRRTRKKSPRTRAYQVRRALLVQSLEGYRLAAWRGAADRAFRSDRLGSWLLGSSFLVPGSGWLDPGFPISHNLDSFCHNVKIFARPHVTTRESCDFCRYIYRETAKATERPSALPQGGTAGRARTHPVRNRLREELCVRAELKAAVAGLPGLHSADLGRGKSRQSNISLDQ